MIVRINYTFLCLAVVFVVTARPVVGFQATLPNSFMRTRSVPASALEMSVGFYSDDKLSSRRLHKDNSLSAASLTLDLPKDKENNLLDFLQHTVLPVVSGALLITGNTVGAGCLVLPELAAGPGLASASGIFAGAYAVNLISALVLAEVAIKQKEQSDADVPSSFKEFAGHNLKSNTAANVISGISLFVNACVMAFDLSRAGAVGAALTGMDRTLLSIGWAGILSSLLAACNNQTLSKAASVCVTALFVSFTGLLLPGLAHIDVQEAFLKPGLADDWTASMAHAAPVILMSMIFQNIVPTVTKLMNYDRVKTVSSIALGSAMPLCMYVAWCLVCCGGGIDTTLGGDSNNVLLTVFSLATLAGSSIGSGMSLAEELDSFGDGEVNAKDAGSKNIGHFQPVSAAVAVGVPLTAALFFAGGQDFTQALSLAGSFGSPILYGAIPALMAWNQRRRATEQEQQHLVPGASLPILGALSTGFIGEELFSMLGDVAASL